MEEIFHIQAAELVFDRVSMLFGGFLRRFSRLFHGFLSVSGREATEVYSFHGMICYCGQHYVALFWCPARRMLGDMM